MTGALSNAAGSPRPIGERRPDLSAVFDFAQIRSDRPFARWLVAELRSDHAGEVGAVQIYRGALRACRNSRMRRHILRHLETEQRHLLAIEHVLDPGDRSRALALWKVAGWLLGYIACRCGEGTYHRTIAAVETFVDQHYDQQIKRLMAEGGNGELIRLLRAFQEDEVQHRDEAVQHLVTAAGPIDRLWVAMVGAGSAAAVALARRL